MTLEEQMRIEHYKAECAIKLEEYKSKCAISLEKYKSDVQTNFLMAQATVNFAIAATKSLMLANGAAVIALLTFIGNSGKVGNVYNTVLLAQALANFAYGVCAAVLASGLSYVAQAVFAETPAIEDEIGIPIRAQAFRYSAVAAAIISLVLFTHGVLVASHAFYS